jgi:hypothetical protein
VSGVPIIIRVTLILGSDDGMAKQKKRAEELARRTS